MLKGTALMGFHETNKLSSPVGIKLVHPQVYWVIIQVFWGFGTGVWFGIRQETKSTKTVGRGRGRLSCINGLFNLILIVNSQFIRTCSQT